MSFLRKNFDFALLGLIIAGFLLIATQRLATVPVPDTDESYMLQISYEMIYRGKLANPFLRYLGGNIENNLHSFMPLHYVIQSGFLKIFGWGLLPGRVFNLITAMTMLVMVFVIGRKLFDWRAGLAAVLLLACDVTFLERSRYMRNDYSASMFALLAYFLYEAAERRKSWRLFLGSGLAGGAALMCHTVTLYMLAAIPLLMLFRRGWRVIKAPAFYQFAAGALIVSAYEIISIITDYQNVLLQNRDDKIHFRVLGAMGWLKNIRNERRRYAYWYAGSKMPAEVPRTLLHLFQILAVIALIYLIIRLVIYFKRGKAMDEARVRVLAVSVTAILFFSVITSQKAIYYMAHLAPWFALMTGVLISDSLGLLERLRTARFERWKPPKLAHTAVIVLLAALALAFGYQIYKQNKRYLRVVRNPEIASFEEFKTAIRSLVPDGVCPVVVRDPVIWLAFPEHDLCFANIQERTKKAADIDGNEYALIVSPALSRRWLKAIARNNHHLLGEILDSPYGSYEVYYTGVDPRWIALAPIRYQFFGRQRGFLKSEAASKAPQDF
jgi:4-amino-4-deoxy-L-arabinose transferase-like glycosyltransferase